MHTVKVERHDTAARLHHTNTGVRPVEHYQEHAHGLYVARSFVSHPRIRYWQAHLLPALGIVLCRYQLHAGTPFDYYIDMARISRQGALWEVRDQYLDVLVWQGSRAEIHDTDELLEAMRAGAIGTEEGLEAVERAHRVINGLAHHAYDVDAWLAAQGTELSWRAPTEPLLVH